MLTIIETPLFTKLWSDYWTEDERGEFATWLATQPEIGDVLSQKWRRKKSTLET